MAVGERRYDLDWLRVIAFALLMLFHTGMMFSSWDWHIKNLETSEGFDLVMRFVHQWRMPLLFFISGSAIWFAMDRYSVGRYLAERQKRLLLPLFFGILVVIPPQVYVERLYHHQQYDSFWDFYRTVYTTGSYPQGNLSWHHLWYVPYIWVYSMLTLPFCLLLRSRPGRSGLGCLHKLLARPWGLFLIFLPAAASDILIRPYYPDDFQNLLDDWGNFSHKLTFFVLGFVLASAGQVYDVMAAHRRKFLAGGIAACLLLQPLWLGWWHVPRSWNAAYHLLHNFHIWMWLLMLLGYGRHYLSFNHPALRYGTDAVYPFYILHQTVIVLLGYQLIYLNWSIGTKFLVVLTGTIVITWAIYAFLIKPFNVLRIPFGMKRKSRQQTIEAAPPAPALAAAPGVSPQGESAVARSTTAGSACDTHSSTRLPLFVLCLAAALSLAGCSGKWSQQRVEIVSAPSLATNLMGIPVQQPVVIYLPRSYQESTRRFPVLYLLPNHNNNLWRYTGGSYQGFRIQEEMDEQVRRGRVQEMIVVLPNTTHWLGGSWYHNSSLTGNWEECITRDLVEYVDTHFRTLRDANSRAIAGHGMGGTGALGLALKHPDIFGTAYALSPGLFDTNGLRDLGFLSESFLRHWHARAQGWSAMPTNVARIRFRDYFQTSINSWERSLNNEALAISYAAAFSPDPQGPFPHIRFPLPGVPEADQRDLLSRFESGFGGWEAKLAAYSAKARRVNAITIEHGGAGEYEWIRNGAKHVSELMMSLGITNTLVISSGGHDGALGSRLSKMLPVVSATLKGE